MCCKLEFKNIQVVGSGFQNQIGSIDWEEASIDQNAIL